MMNHRANRKWWLYLASFLGMIVYGMIWLVVMSSHYSTDEVILASDDKREEIISFSHTSDEISHGSTNQTTSSATITWKPLPTKPNIEAKLGSRAKSIVFLKAFKVGGTTISSLLSAYAFNSNLKMAPIDNWCRGKTLSLNKQCVDIIGTDHPKYKPCNYRQINSADFCNPAEAFMMLRNPVDRLWSGYRHEVRIAGHSFALSVYLHSNTVVKVKVPSHHLLHKNAASALKRTDNIHILLHHMYDESLVFMALKTGMKLCDIMYTPCKSGVWGATKCNQQTKVNMTSADLRDLQMEANKTGEQIFYSSLVTKAEKKLRTKEIKKLTAQYRKIREIALGKCAQDGVLDAIKNMFDNHPYVKRSRDKERLYHLQTEFSNPLDPLTVCLGWYCHEKY